MVLLKIAAIVFLGLNSLVLSWKYPEDPETAHYFFRTWKQEHQKEYNSNREEKERFNVFQKNLKYINELNAEYEGKTKFAANHLADMSPEEFRAIVLMPKRSPAVFEKERYINTAVTDPLPESFDWTQKKVITPVKDQGAGGTCWAFSAIANIEGQWALMGKPLTNFSVEQLVECDGMEDVKGGHADCGVFGGWPYLAYEYVEKAGGLETWEDYFYCSGLGGKPGTCANCPAAGYNDTLCGPPIPYCNMTQSCPFKLNPSKFVPDMKVASWRAISENETVIAQQLMQVGPLSIALNAELLQFYHSGVFEPFICNPKNLDHAVLLVGWGKEKGFFETKYYWKVKNSWGPKWGEHGYFRIKRNVGMCGMNTQVTTSILHK